MDSWEQAKYCFFRIFLMFGVNALGLLIGKGLFWTAASLMTFLPESAKQALVSDKVGSVAAAVVMVLFLAAVFRDDGRKHAAYADADFILALIALILMLIFYFIPSIFYNPFDSTRVVRTLYYMFYYPCRWVIELFGAELKTAVAVGAGIILGIQLIIYNVSYGAYRVKHPFVFKVRDTETDTDTEEETEQDPGSGTAPLDDM